MTQPMHAKISFIAQVASLKMGIILNDKGEEFEGRSNICWTTSPSVTSGFHSLFQLGGEQSTRSAEKDGN